MLKTILPRNRYNTTTYPNLEERAEKNVSIPLSYGPKKNITPVLIDQDARQYKLSDNALSAIDDIRCDDVSFSRVDAINGVTVGAPGAGEFKVKGDQTATYIAALSIKIINSTGNDGTYTVKAGGSSYAGGVTTIPVDEAVGDATVDGDIMQSSEADFTGDLVNGEFTFVTGSPLVTGGSTYYIIWTADYALSDDNLLWVTGRNVSTYAAHKLYFINGADVWDAGKVEDASFEVYGRKVPAGAEELLIDNSASTGDAFANTLRIADGSHTKIAQSFTVPGTDNYYITKIRWRTYPIGTIAGGKKVWVEIHSDKVGTQVGGNPTKVECSTLHSANMWQAQMDWSVLTASDIKVDIYGKYDQIDDILDDVMQNQLNVAAGDIDAVALAALGAANTQILGIYLNREITFGQFVEKLEAGQLFKFIPKLDGTYTFVMYAAGAASLYLYKENFLSFSSYRDLAAVRRTIKIKFNENPTDQRYDFTEDSSNIAKWLYKNEESLEVETYLYTLADAVSLRDDYITLLEYPPRIIDFEVQGVGFDLMPTDKVNITRPRGDNTSGAFDGVLFRILEITKRLGDNTTKIKAQLDTQTYV